MSYEIKLGRHFKKVFKRLKKRYPNIVNDVDSLVQTLKIDPTQGAFLGEDTYKIRIQISDKNKGKSAGGRVITLVILSDNEVVLLAIYDKSDEENISDKEIKELRQEYLDSKTSG